MIIEMEQKMKFLQNRKNRYLCYLLIMAMQVLVMLYWGTQKQNYHIDELYSMGYANSFVGTGDTATYIVTSPEWEFEEWVENSEYKKHIQLSENERITNLSVVEAVKKILSGRSYFGFLNLIQSLVGSETFTIKTVIGLNIIFFIIAEIALLSLMQKLNMSGWSKICSLMMFGFSGYIISFVIYIRFYMLVMMLFLLMMNLFYSVWNSDRLGNNILATIGILIFAYLQFKNSELAIAFFGVIFVSFYVALIIEKKKKQTVFFSVVGIMGIIFALCSEKIMGMIINPRGQATRAFSHMENISFNTFDNYFKWICELLSDYYFGNYMVILFTGLLLSLVLLSFFGKKEDLVVNNIVLRKPALINVLVWFGIYVFSHYLGMGTNFSLLIFFLSVIYFVIDMLGLSTKIKNVLRANYSQETKFIIIFSFGVLFYTIFCTVAGFQIGRYYCYGLVSFMIIFWYCIDRWIRRIKIEKLAQNCCRIMGLFACACAIITFSQKNVDNIFNGDEYLKYGLREYGSMDTVVLVQDKIIDGDVSAFEVYDCVYLMPEDARIFAIEMNNYSYHDDFPDEFILWGNIGGDMESVTFDLEEHGYTIEPIGTNHVSQVYICRIH